jgi:sugar/nucleoside kinase (ribokinase family)
MDALYFGMVMVDYTYLLKNDWNSGGVNHWQQRQISPGGGATLSAAWSCQWGLEIGLVGCHSIGNDEPEKYLKKAALLVLDGTFGQNQQVMLQAAKMAKKYHKQVIISDIDEQHPLYPYADIVIASSHKGSFVTAAKKSYQQKKKTFILTHGKEGCEIFFYKKQQFFPLPFQEDIIDENGAGDVFRSGIILGIQKKWNWDKTLYFAMFIATRSCQIMGGFCQENYSHWLDSFHQLQTQI